MSSSLSSSNGNQSKETRTKPSEPSNSQETTSEQLVPVKKTSNANDLRMRMASMTNLALENIGLDTKMEGPTWSSKWEALAATVSFVACSGNFWVFPYLCSYYGSWFPFQFAACFVLIAVPLLYMEIALGQYASASPLSVFSRMAPAMAGLSAAMCFLLVFRTISLSTWAVYDLTIAVYSSQSAWNTPPWQHCPLDTKYCVDYKLSNCTWAPQGSSSECDHYHNVLIATRGISQRKSPFLTFIQRVWFEKRDSHWQIPNVVPICCCLAIWLIVGIVSIGGSKVLGRTGVVTLVLLLLGVVMLVSAGIWFEDTAEVVGTFFYNNQTDEGDKWMWVWSWADAAAHALRALNVGCGGIQKFASLNKFHNKIHRDVLLISLVSLAFYLCMGLVSFMFMAELGRLYYPNLPAEDRISLYTSPVLIEIVVSEILTNFRLGSFWVFLFWLTLVVCSIQGISSYIWVISSMIVERINGSRRKYGKPLASWHKRAIVLAVMCVAGFVSTFPFLGNGAVNQMSNIDTFTSYGTVFIAFVEIITVSYLYGFKRFSVNIRAMIGGKGRPNVFWWLNWFVVSPLLLLLVFGCVLATFGQRKAFSAMGDELITEIIGWFLLVMPMLFVLSYFIREDFDRRRNMEPFAVMLRATGDWGPMYGEDRREALRFERQLRVRY